jgi:hypothetical protein
MHVEVHAFLKADVTSLLPDDDPAILAHGTDKLLIPEAGDFRHRVISISSDPGERLKSSSTGSK